ncbi:hypothetical protein BX600DRAFT_454239 [Xylariales sp. PMI_506]|nr:hypothetical protein BX600DRAFT_454239 [Xylariales sp. PMI_506]
MATTLPGVAAIAGPPRTASPMRLNGMATAASKGSNAGTTTNNGRAAQPSSQLPLPPPPPPVPAVASTQAPVLPPIQQSAPSQWTPLSNQGQIPPPSQTTQLPPLASLSEGKVAIVEPPGAASRHSTAGSSRVFASPTRDHARENPKFREDVFRLTHAIQQSLSEAVRSVIRDHWEKTLLGSDFHQAFVMNAVIHHANGQIIRRAIRDFGHKMVKESKDELINHFNTQDLDAVADVILERASDGFLDKAMERRLATIDARSLINALARAERLGYESKDINLSNQGGLTTVSPDSFHQVIMNSVDGQYQNSPQPQARPLQASQNIGSVHGSGTSFQCPLCYRNFTTLAPYDYHVKKQLCTKSPPDPSGFPYSCAQCGAGFVTSVGQQYHLANRVCGEHGIAPATPKTGAPSTNSPTHNLSRHHSPAQSSALPPLPPPPAAAVAAAAAATAPVTSSGQHTFQATPYRPMPPPSQAYTTPSSTPPGPFSSVADPYAHLTPETRTRMEEDLRLAEEAFAPRFKHAESIEDPAERKQKQEALQNSFSTKQSIIRKKYGVRLRQRRTKAEIEAERERLHGHASTPWAKRQRGDDDIDESPQDSSQQQPAVKILRYSPTKHLTVTDMKSSGLGKSGATAATADPTHDLSQGTPSRPAPPPRNSLSSYQQNGYRIDTHMSRAESTGQSKKPQEQAIAAPSGSAVPSQIPQPAMQSPTVSRRSGSATEPVVLDDSGSSDSDSDADIPAVLSPGRRASEKRE